MKYSPVEVLLLFLLLCFCYTVSLCWCCLDSAKNYDFLVPIKDKWVRYFFLQSSDLMICAIQVIVQQPLQWQVLWLRMVGASRCKLVLTWSWRCWRAYGKDTPAYGVWTGSPVDSQTISSLVLCLNKQSLPRATLHRANMVRLHLDGAMRFCVDTVFLFAKPWVFLVLSWPATSLAVEVD